MSRVEDSNENAAICMKNCEPCITYPGIEGEALFCARGKSSAPKAKNGCNCGNCEVRKKAGCSGFYYCIKGPCE